MNVNDTMEYGIAKTVPINIPVVTSSSVAWSEDNNVAAITFSSIHIYDLYARVHSKENFLLEKNTIPNLTAPNPALSFGISRARINVKVPFSDISDFVVDRSLLPDRSAVDTEGGGFRQVSWSPTGLQPGPHRCILAALTADFRLVLYGSKFRKWEALHEPSLVLAEHLKSQFFDQEPEEKIPASNVAAEAKNRAYRLSVLSVAWSPVISNGEENWSWLFGLQRSGHLAVWRVTSNGKMVNVDVHDFIDLQVRLPSAFTVHQEPSGNFIILVGTCLGTVDVLRLDSSCSTLTVVGSMLPDADCMIVSHLSVRSFEDSYLAVAVKNNAFCYTAFTGQGEGLGNHRFHVFRSLQITGFNLSADGAFVCSTEDGQMFQGQFRKASGNQVDIEDLKPVSASSPHVSVKGVCYAADSRIVLCALETLKVLYDSSRCKQVSFLVFHYVKDIDVVARALKEATSMTKAAVLLETYKTFYLGAGSDIWQPELDNLDKRPFHFLQLAYWIANYRSRTNTTKKTKDEQRAAPQMLEYCLRLRHVASVFQRVLERDAGTVLSEDQLLSLHLAAEFASVTLSVSHSSELDFSSFCSPELLRNIRRIIENANPQELCAVCGESVAFEKVDSGSCSRKHQAPRCAATMRLCFSKTRRCCCCAAFYHKDNVFGDIVDCILCGGPLQ